MDNGILLINSAKFKNGEDLFWCEKALDMLILKNLIIKAVIVNKDDVRILGYDKILIQDFIVKFNITHGFKLDVEEVTYLG